MIDKDKDRDIWDILLEAKNRLKANAKQHRDLVPRTGSFVMKPVELPEDFTPPPRAWGVNVGPIPLPNESPWPSILASHVTGKLDDLVVGIDPGTPGAIIVAARGHGKNMIWLERVCEDEEGRALVQAILDRKKKKAGK